MADSRFFKNNGPINLEEIVKISESKLYNNADSNRLFDDISTLKCAKENHISILHNEKYIDEFKSTKAGACLISEKYIKYAPDNIILLISDNPYKSYSMIANRFYGNINQKKYISPKSIIADSAIIGKNSIIEDDVIIEDNAVIGNNSVIKSGSVIGSGVIIGDGCIIYQSVTITHSIIGNNNIIKSGARIGNSGFGFASDKNGHYNIPQIGRVIIGNNCLIGNNTCIDRGSLDDTEIGNYCMIDNLVQIAHNVKIGNYCILVAMTGIAGSTKIGDFVVIGGQVGIAGHLNIGSFSKIAAGSGVIKDIEDKETYGGYPAIPVNMWHRQSIILKKLVKSGI